MLVATRRVRQVLPFDFGQKVNILSTRRLVLLTWATLLSSVRSRSPWRFGINPTALPAYHPVFSSPIVSIEAISTMIAVKD